MKEAENLVNKEEAKAAEAKMEEIKALDNKWEETKLANANLNALKDQDKGVNLENKSEIVGGSKVMEITNIENIVNMKKEDLLASDTYRNGYLKELQGKELTKLENAAVSADSVIPTQTMNKIIEKLEQTSVLYNKITVSNFPNKLSIPRENAKNDASWVDISTDSTDSADTFDSIALGANKLIKTIEIEADVQAMSIDMFESFIVRALSKKLAKAIENAILNGTGTGQPTGLTKAGEVANTGTYTNAGMTYVDLMTMIADLPTSYHQNAEFVTTREIFFKEIMGMVDTNGQPIVHPDAEAPSKFNILGYPVTLDDYMPLDNVLFGDLEYYQFNWAKPIEISFDKSVGFRKGSTVYRGLGLADGKNTLPEAFVLYTRAGA